MTYAVWVPVLLGLLLPLAARPLAASVPPRVAAQTLAFLGVVVAACSAWCLLLLACSLAVPGPIPRGVGLAAVPLAAGLAVVAVRTARREAGPLLAIDRALPAGKPVVVVAGATHAHALAGVRRGRIEVGDGLLAALAPAERRAVLAHERAHLAGRHALLRSVARASAALHPGLRRLPGMVDACCERAADEAAASVVGDRAVVARALARAALTGARQAAPAGGAAFGLVAVTARVDALLAPAPRLRPGVPVLAAVCLGLALVVLATLHADWDLGSLALGSP